MTSFAPRTPLPALRDLRPQTPALKERPAGLLRRYEVAWQPRADSFDITHHTAPATPVFEAAFSAFAHGALLQTPNGPVAIEDILPGDVVDTVEHGPLPVVWRGSMTLVPNSSADRPEQAQLTRFMADSLGMERPMRDVLAGPGARILHRPQTLRDQMEDSLMYSLARDFCDGQSVFQITPPSAVQVYHLCLPMHSSLRVNGLEMESYHPGTALRSSLTPQMLSLFLSLFPHIEHPGDFGALVHPRFTASRNDLDHETAA